MAESQRRLMTTPVRRLPEPIGPLRELDHGAAARAEPAEQRGAEAHAADGPAPHTEEQNPEAPNPRARPFYKRPILMLVLAVLLVGGAVAGFFYWRWSRQFEWTDDAFLDGRVTQMAPKVGGYVVQLLVDDNQQVRAGDLLLEIDPRDYQTALEQAEATAASDRSKIQQAQNQITANEADLKAAQAEVAANQATALNAEQELERNRPLAKSGVVTPATIEQLVATARSTAAQTRASIAKVNTAEAQVKLAESQKRSAEADLRTAQAQIDQAKLNLSYTKIAAPVAGRITRRSVELGNYLQPGQALFAIVQNGIWVTANFKETQLTYMHRGQPVEIRIDAYPGRALAGKVDSFQRGTGAQFSLLPTENATGNYVKVVQRVPVKIVFTAPPPDDMLLALGMSVVPRVSVR